MFRLIYYDAPHLWGFDYLSNSWSNWWLAYFKISLHLLWVIGMGMRIIDLFYP